MGGCRPGTWLSLAELKALNEATGVDNTVWIPGQGSILVSGTGNVGNDVNANILSLVDWPVFSP